MCFNKPILNTNLTVPTPVFSVSPNPAPFWPALVCIRPKAFLGWTVLSNYTHLSTPTLTAGPLLFQLLLGRSTRGYLVQNPPVATRMGRSWRFRLSDKKPTVNLRMLNHHLTDSTPKKPHGNDHHPDSNRDQRPHRPQHHRQTNGQLSPRQPNLYPGPPVALRVHPPRQLPSSIIHASSSVVVVARFHTYY